MLPCRLHITGASGTGTTMLGRALADAWAVPHADVDDYFWEPTDPPYVVKRPASERLELMEAVYAPRRAWVLSGSLMGWGDVLIKRFDAVVFLTLDPSTRIARLKARERTRLGASVDPGGSAEPAYRAFIEWAQRYDDAFTGRSRRRHDRWVSELPCPVLHLDSTNPVPTLVAAVLTWTATIKPE